MSDKRKDKEGVLHDGLFIENIQHMGMWGGDWPQFRRIQKECAAGKIRNVLNCADGKRREMAAGVRSMRDRFRIQ